MKDLTMLLIATSILCTLRFAESVVPQYSYMVLVPRNIRRGSTLSIPVHFGKPVLSESVTAKLIETNYLPGGVKETRIITEKAVNVDDGKTDALIEVPVPTSVSWGSYTLNVSGSGTVKFDQSTYLSGRKQSMIIFVQTDKAMYKPGETVQYRVFAVNGQLSLVDPLMDIEIFDPKRIKIQEEIGVRNKLGVEGNLSLSDMPPLGRWRIAVTAKETDEKENYYFDVAEYILPKFEVTVTLPTFGKESDPSLVGKAKAAYTFGKPVDGSAVITISRHYDSGFFDLKAVRTEMKLVNGEATFEIPMTVLKKLTRNIGDQNFRVEANVREAITGITLKGQGEIQYYRNPYKIEFYPNMPDIFKLGFGPYKVWVKVAQHDNRPPEQTNERLSITVTYFTDKPVPGKVSDINNFTVLSPFVNGDVIMEETTTYSLSEDGMVKFDLHILNNTATATIKAEFAGIKSYKEIRRFRSPSETFLQAQVMNNVTENPLKIGDILKVKVVHSNGPVAAKYIVLSRGQVVVIGDIVIRGTSNEGVLQLGLTRAMAPTSRLVVYYVKEDGEIVADGLNLVIDEIFQNKVKIEFVQSSPQRPKATVDLKVTADKNSLVNVLAVDKSAKLLAEGNDITLDRVKDAMNRFGDSPGMLRGWGSVAPWPFAADDAYDIFDHTQLRVLTDAYLHRFDLVQQRSSYYDDSIRGFRMGTYSSPTVPIGQIRKDFPETWIWKSQKAVNGNVVFTEIVPDTITEFVANAFAVNTETGLGVAPSTANLKVFLSFFVNLQLPYSVVRNEIAVIQANIFNYGSQDYNVLVTLKGSPDFVGVTAGVNNTIRYVFGDMTKCILVKKDRPTPVYFNIKPLKVGTLMLNVRADISKPTFMFDEVRRTLPVKAEGMEKEKNIPMLVSLQTKGYVRQERGLVYPSTLVPDSERTRVTVFGDLFGASLKNLDSLIKMPYGCGEQNMVHFAPSIFAVVYMRKTGRFDSDKTLQNKIKKVLLTGYQRQLLYRRYNGGFSAFGEADAEASLWLTAFVMKSFAQAHSINVIFVDPKVVEGALKYVFRLQNPNGTLNNVGTVIHKALQGGTASSERSMMAYVLIALQEVKEAGIIKNEDIIQKLKEAIQKLTAALELKVPEMTSDYERAIGAYALKQVNSSAYETLLNALEMSFNKVDDGKKRHWENPSRALEVEIASYALLTYAALGNKDKGLVILNWLIDNKNPYGGFVSTQDTVVALQAFSEFATLVYSKDVSLTIDIFTRTGRVESNGKQIKLNQKNHDLLQFVDIVGKFDKIVVEVKGVGLAMIEINQFYNVEKEEGQAYDLTVTTSDVTEKRYTVTACARYNISNSRSNMAIMDIGVLSGFEPLEEQMIRPPLVKRVEKANSRLVVYLDEIPSKNEVCVSVPVQRVSVVGAITPGNVVVYSYYEPMEKVMISYLPNKLQETNTPFCKACENVCCATDNLLDNMVC